jgi:hypothetical protein
MINHEEHEGLITLQSVVCFVVNSFGVKDD